MDDAFIVVNLFERSLAEYCGAKYAVAVNSCSAALRLALKGWKNTSIVTIPRHTYRSVYLVLQDLHYGVRFSDEKWDEYYQIKPTNVWDCALLLCSGMYVPGTVQCLSFHPQKPLALSSGGGAILHDDDEMDKWYRWQRWDGRQGGVAIQDDELRDGEHCYMFPAQAGEALHKLNVYASRPPVRIPHPNYEDLSKKVNHGIDS